MKYPILSKAEVWDDENRYEYGAIMADSYSNAAYELENYYGSDLISLKLFMCEEGPLFLDKETYKKIIETPM